MATPLPEPDGGSSSDGDSPRRRPRSWLEPGLDREFQGADRRPRSEFRPAITPVSRGPQRYPPDGADTGGAAWTDTGTLVRTGSLPPLYSGSSVLSKPGSATSRSRSVASDSGPFLPACCSSLGAPFLRTGSRMSCGTAIPRRCADHPADLRVPSPRRPRADAGQRGGSGVISTVPGGYRLEVRAATVDAVRFEELVAAARSSLAADPAAASALLKQALGLWRGDVLADLASMDGFVAPVAARLDELRAAATDSGSRRRWRSATTCSAPSTTSSRSTRCASISPRCGCSRSTGPGVRRTRWPHTERCGRPSTTSSGSSPRPRWSPFTGACSSRTRAWIWSLAWHPTCRWRTPWSPDRSSRRHRPSGTGHGQVSAVGAGRRSVPLCSWPSSPWSGRPSWLGTA